MMRKATLFDPRYRGDHMKPPELSAVKNELIAEMVAVAATASTPGPAQVRDEEEESGGSTAPKKKCSPWEKSSYSSSDHC